MHEEKHIAFEEHCSRKGYDVFTPVNASE